MDIGWTTPFVGVPYKVHGRTAEGADCWGIVRMALATGFGKQVPDYADEYGSLLEAPKAVAKHRDSLDTVPSPEPGDIVLMKLYGDICHVALFVGNNTILHADPFGSQPSRLERMTRALTLRVEGYYRVN